MRSVFSYQMFDEDLGELSEQGDGLSCSFTHGDQVVTVTILLEGALPEEVIPPARELKRSFDTLIERAWQLLVDEVLPIINKGYRGDGELPVADQEFRRVVRFAGATVGSEGDYTFHFHDGDLLWGHWINADLSSSGVWRSSIGG
jgi:hypothetical protein